MNTKRLLMLNRLNLAALREDVNRFDHGELVEIQSDLIETLRLCSDQISRALRQEIISAEQVSVANRR